MYLFRVATAQALSLKSSLDSLVHAHINETNLVLNKSGISVTEIDPSHALVVRLFLERPSFQIYELQENLIMHLQLQLLIFLLKQLF